MLVRLQTIDLVNIDTIACQIRDGKISFQNSTIVLFMENNR